MGQKTILGEKPVDILVLETHTSVKVIELELNNTQLKQLKHHRTHPFKYRTVRSGSGITKELLSLNTKIFKSVSKANLNINLKLKKSQHWEFVNGYIPNLTYVIEYIAFRQYFFI